ncbi:AAA family ATPase [Cohnella thermotolerans]|uniref:AAA family ATPase n=1 Tax=Cohnella thermotolerans TaxID=329858 RepID=UPI000420E771|nr:AAA family ATPase [Cohnella thermotolerans]
MKPIQLELAGLQSYREKMTVDFERLCGGGVFGIFGPTGSGKSSILDAMTLALYGRVERAAKGTQGIMNGAENKLSVAFTFELSGGGERARYRVERQYKRAGESGVHSSLCRLIETGPDGDRVLADKQGEVDAAVERLIGLTMPDFTRAVVLPQGKFAEFLTLTGKDRRQMLQRLFRLERYGDKLAARLSARAESVRAALRETEAEQQGLGDASPEALQAALERLAEAKETARKLREELLRAETEHESLTRMRERQLELRRVEERLAALDAEAPRMEEREKLLERLKQAERLFPAIRDADEAEREALVRANELGAAEARCAESAKEAETAEAAWLASQETAARREPELILQCERMSQAVKLEEEAEEWNAKRTALAMELVHTETQNAAAENAYAEAADRLQRAKAKQAQLRAQWEELSPQAEAGGRLLQAAARKEQVLAAERQADEAGREADDWLGRHQAAQARTSAAREALQTSLRKGRLLRLNHVAIAGQSAALAARLAELSAAAADAADAEAHARSAALLAAGLHAGEPCPVCGSLTHPHPAAAERTGDGSVPWPAIVRELEERARDLAALRDKSAWHAERLRARLDEAESSFRAQEAFGAEAPGDLAAQEAAAAAEAERLPQPALPSLPEEWQMELERIDRLLDGLRTQSGNAVADQERWESGLTAALREWALASEGASALASTVSQSREKRDRLKAQAEALRGAWNLDFPDVPYDSAEALAQSASAAEKEARALRERLDKSVDFVGGLEQQVRTLERDRHALALRTAELRARAEAVAASADGVAAKLREWTNGLPAARLLAEAERERRELQTALAEAKRRRESAQRELQVAEAQRTAAAERQSAAAVQRERARLRLAESLQASGFASAEEVRPLAARLPEMPAIAEEIETHRRLLQQLNGQAKLLRESMPGEPVGEEAWAASAAKVRSLKENLELAMAAAAKSERDAEDLSARRERWERLEARRTALAEEGARMAQLQAVFRGNAFVEYVAEEQLEQVCRAASERLGYLTRRRYALEVDAGGGFVIRDDANGGLRRPVSTLSGGETFLTSLALALALSAQIQLRGRYPLQFFFLDEGFGTLDPELLDTVVTSLEKLQQDDLAVGIISHVPELQARLPRRLLVIPAEPGGRGSRIAYDTI